ncbi:MAG: Gfo/Idh/MocA family oxidoreductase [Chloroflexi bacterium]|nr:Gfo/Idh/MocA family oxidoreductase [Chloroflexota bacterium]
MRVGLIGTGHWAIAVHGRGVVSHPAAELVGVWGRDPARAQHVADELGSRPYPSLAGLVADVDALTFAVPPDVQVSIASSAAQAGKHLLLEKPIATSIADAQKLQSAIGQAGVASIVFFTRRFIAEHESWLNQVRQTGGWECARVEMSSAIFVEGNPFGNSPWRKDKGALWDVGPHALSTLIPLLGKVDSVIAGAGVRDQVHLVLQHTGPRSSTASLSLTVPPAAVGNALYVYGEHGRAEAPSGQFDVGAAYRRALDALVEQAGASKPAHACDVHFGAQVVGVLAAAEESLHSGRRIEIQN